ncbi:MAG: hypothetical protein AAGB14_00830 [Verrucomicrobiota bacterium]
MRRIVTLDPDTEFLLWEEVLRSKRSFEEVLNLAIRRSLGSSRRPTSTVEPLFPAAFPEDLMTQSMNRVADDLGDEDILRAPR